MKKIFALVLVSAFALPFAGCKSGPSHEKKSFPAVAITGAKSLDGLTIGAPPGAAIEAIGDDGVLIKGPDYSLKVTKSDKSLAPMKELLGKMKTFKGWVESSDDTLVAELDEASGKQFMVMHTGKAGDVSFMCESTMTAPAKSAEKALEATDVCGSVAKK